jgi:hypothetical protein
VKQSSVNLLAAAAVAATCACTGPAGPAGADGADGADGTNGTNGTNGADGTNGTNGTDGVDGVDRVLDPALAPLDKMFAALGGRAAVLALTGLEVDATGTRFIAGEGPTPDADPAVANDYATTTSLDLEQDFARVDTSRTISFLFTGTAQTYSEIAQGYPLDDPAVDGEAMPTIAPRTAFPRSSPVRGGVSGDGGARGPRHPVAKGALFFLSAAPAATCRLWCGS